jgi:hypothetical protein
MNIRIGLYDFFAYTLPGSFFILVICYFLYAYGILKIDPISELKSLTVISFVVILGIGYIFGLLIDPISYRWARLFQKRFREAAKEALDEFHRQHNWIFLNIEPTETSILLQAVKRKSIDQAMDVEQHNVVSILLRNISFCFILISINCLIFFFAYNFLVANIILAVLFFALAILAVRRSRIRRHWFLMAVYEAFYVHYLLDNKIIVGKFISPKGTEEDQAQNGKELAPTQEAISQTKMTESSPPLGQ